MLGYFRFTLALLVAFNHLWFIGGIGRLAVFSFYVISGYLMTAIITNTYGTNLQGLKKYATNRLLRIYPLYLVCFAVFSILLYGIDLSALRLFDSNLSVPNSPLNWVMNASLIGLDFSVQNRTIPPSWTLFVELFFYAAIPLLLKIDKRLVIIWLATSVFYHAYHLYNALPSDPFLNWNARYGTVMAGSLGFAIGCASRLYLPHFLKSKSTAVVSALILASCYALTIFWATNGLNPDLTRYISTIVFYGSTLATAPVVDYLARMKPTKVSDSFGEYSYPFYLAHIPTGFLVYYYVGATEKTWQTLALGICASLAVSWLLIRFDRFFLSFRKKNKSTAQARMYAAVK